MMPSGSRTRRRSGELTGRALLVVLIGPSLALIGVFTAYPLFSALWISLHSVGPLVAHSAFVGIKNYIQMVHLPLFWTSVRVTAYFAAVSIAVQLPLGLAAALLLNRKFVGRGALRAIVLIPWAIPTIANAVLWQWIYDAKYGALNGLLQQLGILREPVAWLAEPAIAINAVIVADTWKVLPIYALMFLAGLQSIPADRYEAAAVDGAGAWRRFVHVTLPALRPILLVILVLRTIEIFRVFDIVYMLTHGGPAGQTTVIAFLSYQQSFQSLNFGLGSAIGLAVGVATIMAAIVYFRLLHTEEELS